MRDAIYVPVDIRQHVYSPTAKRTVRNRAVDINEQTAASLLLEVERAVQDKQKGGKWKVAYVWWSPECTTYTKADAVNRNRGAAYRDMRKKHRPPLRPADGGSQEKYRKAKAADRTLKVGLAIIKAWRRRWPNMKSAIENPAEGMRYQRAMQEWERSGYKRHKVEYCAYGHPYNKPTDIWTDLDWAPAGETGDGRCGQRCTQGERTQDGTWKHKRAIAQESDREVQGPGRQEWKQLVPLALHRELAEQVPR